MKAIQTIIEEFAEAVKSMGGRAMLVGGCVRDELMGRSPKDFDLEVYGLESDKLLEVVRKYGTVDTVGESFSVYKVARVLDVSLPRRERKTGRGHAGFTIEGDPHMSFEESTKRRDFTINAMLKDPLTGEVVDIHGGQRDIKKKTLRMVSDKTFPEDSLRVLRAAQFAARFEFDIDPETAKVCRSIDLGDLPKERIWGEFEKILSAQKPSVGLRYLCELNVVEKIFPQIKAAMGDEACFHKDTMAAVDESRKMVMDLVYPKQVSVMLASILAGMEKHTVYFLDQLNVQTILGYRVREQVIQLAKYHAKPEEFYENQSATTDGDFRRLSREVELGLLYRVSKAAALVRESGEANAQESFIERARRLGIEYCPPEPLLLGRHLLSLGLNPSPNFKTILDRVYEMQLDGEVNTLDEAMTQARKIVKQTKP